VFLLFNCEEHLLRRAAIDVSPVAPVDEVSQAEDESSPPVAEARFYNWAVCPSWFSIIVGP
tara:strand:- start:462 stop:644 length:183 start_codon:yes stop_codon:yes gene_type:complete